MLTWFFIAEIFLILVLTAVFYSSGLRNRFTRIFWIVVLVVVGISFIEHGTCETFPGSNNRCLAWTLRFVTWFFILDLIAISLFLVHRLETKVAEPRVTRNQNKMIQKKRDAEKQEISEKEKQ